MRYLGLVMKSLGASAWGIDHGVSKSYIPATGKFVRITDAGAKKQVKRAVRRNLTPKGRYGVPNVDHIGSLRQTQEAGRARQFKRVSSDLADGIKGMTPAASRTVKGRKINVYNSNEDPGMTLGYTFLQGGKRGTSNVVMHRPSNPGPQALTQFKQTMVHEQAHAAPKRSSWRMYQIGTNRGKAGREEARADLAAGIRWGGKAQSGYHERAKFPLRSRQTNAYRAELRRRSQ